MSLKLTGKFVKLYLESEFLQNTITTLIIKIAKKQHKLNKKNEKKLKDFLENKEILEKYVIFVEKYLNEKITIQTGGANSLESISFIINQIRNIYGYILINDNITPYIDEFLNYSEFINTSVVNSSYYEYYILRLSRVFNTIMESVPPEVIKQLAAQGVDLNNLNNSNVAISMMYTTYLSSSIQSIIDECIINIGLMTA